MRLSSCSAGMAQGDLGSTSSRNVMTKQRTAPHRLIEGLLPLSNRGDRIRTRSAQVPWFDSSSRLYGLGVIVRPSVRSTAVDKTDPRNAPAFGTGSGPPTAGVNRLAVRVLRNSASWLEMGDHGRWSRRVQGTEGVDVARPKAAGCRFEEPVRWKQSAGAGLRLRATASRIGVSAAGMASGRGLRPRMREPPRRGFSQHAHLPELQDWARGGGRVRAPTGPTLRQAIQCARGASIENRGARTIPGRDNRRHRRAARGTLAAIGFAAH